jgi:uncharacterized protein YlaI
MRCYICGQSKPNDEFPRDRSKSSGRASRCRVCDREKARIRYLANRELRPRPLESYVCVNCRGQFTARQPARTCSKACRDRIRYLKRKQRL